MRSADVTHDGPRTGLLWYWIARLWMAVFRWDVEGDPPAGVPRAVVIAAPHTSNWDLPHMLAASFIFRLRLSWMGKDTLFVGPFGWFLRWMGGVPVDRRAPRGMVKEVAGTFASRDRLALAVPPSGTRKRAAHWKSGFYWIAVEAKVPILMCYLDYGARKAGIGPVLHPTGDIRADMDVIRAFYLGRRGKFPESETPVLVREEEAPRVPTLADAVVAGTAGTES